MSKMYLKCLVLLVCVGWSGQALAQFSWENKSIGGGGFCMEVRFDLQELFGQNRVLYLVTDVSGVYRSADFGVTWEMLKGSDPANPDDAIPRYATSIAFTEDFNGTVANQRVIAATKEGIYSWDNTEWEAVNQMPDRSQLENMNPQVNMDPGDGRYPWVGVIRQNPNTNYICAGIGDIRDHQYGLGGVLRSTNGGNDWEFVRIDGAGATAIVYDVYYMYKFTGNNRDCTFLATDEGVFFSDNLFDAENSDDVEFENISTNVDNADPVDR